jgi:hypothetical protein
VWFSFVSVGERKGRGGVGPGDSNLWDFDFNTGWQCVWERDACTARSGKPDLFRSSGARPRRACKRRHPWARAVAGVRV